MKLFIKIFLITILNSNNMANLINIIILKKILIKKFLFKMVKNFWLIARKKTHNYINIFYTNSKVEI